MLAAGLASPVHGQDAGSGPGPSVSGARGSVGDRALAQELHALALARGDAILALAAARLALSVALTDSDRVPEVGAPPPDGAVPEPASAAGILSAARTLAGEDVTLAGLVDEAEAEGARPPAAAVTASRSALAPGQSAVWRVAFFGGALAEVAVLGGAPLTLAVADEAGNPVCTLTPALPVARCSFVPGGNLSVEVTVGNPGAGPAGYVLLTN